ncbi:hypothetical protein RYX45_14445 [Alkalihalophilus pseudofirmus]|uniref:Uncharacterized protein n=1 Tax=Alkalihalophilus pseudofirmus TaxID=79885 RepID=A0AAJ2NPW1_ALKPS|nr:hypothetical protein [Alkalihalophilus pseudofirmus]MDV2886386.1 hypothetical protein [Alkalihalophilus pseudofirmus]
MKMSKLQSCCVPNDQSEDSIAEYTIHAINQTNYRSIYQSVTTNMVDRGYRKITAENGESFLLIDDVIGVSLVASIWRENDLDVVRVITVIDSKEPRNLYGTPTI